MEERSLRITGTDKTFFNKLTTRLTKMLIPTKVGINSMLISMKRSSLLRAFDNLQKENNENYEQDEVEKKFENTYTLYLEALDKYVLDSIYNSIRHKIS